jgi:hypothetical protein
VSIYLLIKKNTNLMEYESSISGHGEEYI